MIKYQGTSQHSKEVFLNPGEFYFADQASRIRTVLGSCVAITLWHPRLKIGGMCHYMLPSRHKKHQQTVLDGRYADEAMALFILAIQNHHTLPIDYVVKLFGGGDQFPGYCQNRPISLPERNSQIGRQLLKQHGFSINAEHLGGTGHRHIIFDVDSGEILINYVAKPLEYLS